MNRSHEMLFEQNYFDILNASLKLKKSKQITSLDSLKTILEQTVLDNDLKLYKILKKHPMYNFVKSKKIIMNCIKSDNLKLFRLIINQISYLSGKTQYKILKTIIKEKSLMIFKFYIRYPRFNFDCGSIIDTIYWYLKNTDKILNFFLDEVLKCPNFELSKNNTLIYLVCERGHFWMLDCLLKYESFQIYNNFNIIDILICKLEYMTPSKNAGYFKCIKLLLTDARFDPTIDNNSCIKHACKYGLNDVVKILLTDQRINPNASNGYPLLISIKKGHIEIVKLLLNDFRVTPGSQNNKVLIIAKQYNRNHIYKLLDHRSLY